MSGTPTQGRKWAMTLLVVAVAALVLTLVVRAIAGLLWGLAIIAIIGAALLFISSAAKKD